MALRGFDDYEITLGDEMRGERACIGKSLGEAERDLCIKVEMLAAIENCDLDAFPNRSVVPGYVRSYARYLGMNPDHCYERFCEESGFRSPLATFGMVPDPARNAAKSGRGVGEAGRLIGGIGVGLTQSRFANAPRTRRIGAPVSLGGLFSGFALVGLVGGLAYGGYALLQDIQRVGFVPLPEAPAVVADAPVIEAPDVAASFTARAARPDAGAYAGSGALAAVVPPSELAPQVAVRRDGPISAINPETSGVFAANADPRAAVDALRTADGTSSERAISMFSAVSQPEAFLEESSAGTLPGATRLTGAVMPELAKPEPAKPVIDPDRVTLVVTEEAWVRIRDRSSAVVFEGILNSGDQFDLSDRIDGPTLRAGNAGGVYIDVGGTLHGPIGRPGMVIKNVSLVAADIRAGVPVAEGRPVGPDGAQMELRSASAEIGH